MSKLFNLYLNSLTQSGKFTEKDLQEFENELKNTIKEFLQNPEVLNNLILSGNCKLDYKPTKQLFNDKIITAFLVKIIEQEIALNKIENLTLISFNYDPIFQYFHIYLEIQENKNEN